MKRARKVDYHLNCRDEWNLHTSLPVSVKHLCGMKEEWLTGRCVLFSVVSLVYPCTSSASLLDGWVLTKGMDGSDERSERRVMTRIIIMCGAELFVGIRIESSVEKTFAYLPPTALI